MQKNNSSHGYCQYINIDYNAINNYNKFLSNLEQINENAQEESLKEKVILFKGINSYKDAMNILKENFSIYKSEITLFEKDSKCKIILKSNHIRISYKSTSECICFDFTKEPEERKKYENSKI